MIVLLALVSASAPVPLVQLPLSHADPCAGHKGMARALRDQGNVWVERTEDPPRQAPEAPDNGVSTLPVTDAGLPIQGWASPGAGMLERACAGDPDLWDDVGLAFTPALLDLAKAPPSQPRTLLHRWVGAVIALNQGTGLDLPSLARGIRLLQEAELPTWVRPTRQGQLAGLHEDTVILYERGAFQALDARTGSLRWTHESRIASPQVEWVHGRPLLLDERGAALLTPDQGQVFALFDLEAPFEQVAISRYGLFVANREELWAVDGSQGSIQWRKTLAEHLVSGPVQVGLTVVVPHRTSVTVMDLVDGRIRQRIRLPGEVSAPLTTSEPDWVWVFLGSRGLASLRLPSSRLIHEVPPLRFEVASVGHGLFGMSGVGSRARLWRIDPVEGASSLAAGSTVPPRPFVDGNVLYGARRSVQARDSEGGLLWSARLSADVRALAVSRELAFAAVGSRVVRVDPRGGELLTAVELGERVDELRAYATLAVARTQSGAVYGIPDLSDPRRGSLMAYAQRKYAEGLKTAGQSSRAEEAYRALLRDRPEDMEAQVALARLSKDPEDWLRVATWAPRESKLIQEVTKRLADSKLTVWLRAEESLRLVASQGCLRFRSEPRAHRLAGPAGVGPGFRPVPPNRLSPDQERQSEGPSGCVTPASEGAKPRWTGRTLQLGDRGATLRLPAVPRRGWVLDANQVVLDLQDDRLVKVNPKRAQVEGELAVARSGTAPAADGSVWFAHRNLLIRWDP